MNNNVNYTAKNNRVISALRNGAEYIVLESDSDYYTLYQVGTDLIPFPVLVSEIGEDAVRALHKPALTIDRDTFVSSKIDDLLSDMVQAMTDSIHDDPDGDGKWTLADDIFTVCTRFSRNHSHSRNGGDYYEYRTFEIQDAGVFAASDWTCEIESLSAMGGDYPSLYRIDVDELGSIVEMAKAML